MQDDSIAIKLFRNGLGNGPEYKITVYDSGRVVYEGITNVKIKDKIETSIDDDKIVTLLEELKESGIFNINQNFSVSESSGRPFTRLTVEMPGEEGSTQKKSVVHYDDEQLIPGSLKRFEDKIDELVESYRWVKVPKTEKKKEPEPVKTTKSFEKPVKETTEIKEKRKIPKIVIPAAIGVIIIVLLAVFLFLNPNIFSNEETQDTDYDPPQILSLDLSNSIFGIDDSIGINFEYDNVTHDNVYDFKGIINIYKGQDLVKTSSFSINSSQSLKESYNVQTDDSWPLGAYKVVFELNDEISGLSAESETTFTLYEEVPKILKLTPASSVTAYKVYNAQSIFDLNDTVFIYTEYTGINTTNDDTACNILFSINVTDYSGKIYWSYSEDKTTVGNNAHWGFNTDTSWTSSIYSVNLYLYDYNTGLSVTKSTVLIINS